MRTKLFMAVVATLALGATGCKQEAAAPQGDQKAQQGIKVAPSEGGAPAAPGTAQPAVHGSQGGPAAGAAAGVTGKVLETMDSGGYSYVKLATAGGEKWAAVRQAAVRVGDEVTIERAMVMKGFTSKTLDRTFDEILFGELGGGSGSAAAPAAGAEAMPAGHPPVGGGEAAMPAGHPQVGGDAPPGVPPTLGDHKAPTGERTEVGAIEKAEGGVTVAEVFAKKAELAGTEITLRGKVTKYNPGIMGRNWLHVQDGTGTPDGKDFDLTVTTSGDVAVDDVVVLKGTLALDKDFGAGYRYDVILENATVTK